MLKIYKCQMPKCGHEWASRKDTEKPNICPKCKSRSYDSKPNPVGRPKKVLAEA